MLLISSQLKRTEREREEGRGRERERGRERGREGGREGQIGRKGERVEGRQHMLCFQVEVNSVAWYTLMKIAQYTGQLSQNQGNFFNVPSETVYMYMYVSLTSSLCCSSWSVER